ncbi:hypothetical protein DQ238_19775 [Geodermatophilus sp. TF02-6]|uniref:hypothetical protein n=1 Tax=Geodermatophilus sp. TF02-6 TaxID=2250575 RepID=UPI000DE8D929|nr:hypothetical protein [Geodermatophilus sp. TF02-6]RBY75481.1 hypothetical protein DQ238_19775 [Geodermatophilus sp. TF02-6]
MLLLPVLLAIGLSLVGVAVSAATAHVLLRDPRVDAATAGAPTARRRRWVDPNEAARAAGSWG